MFQGAKRRFRGICYMITISCQQKATYVPQDELDDICRWLHANGTQFEATIYETGGKYKQLHVHAIVHYEGRWKHLTQFGDLQHTQRTYRIHWKVIGNKTGALVYIHKQARKGILQEQVLAEYFYRHNHNPHWP